MKFTNDWLIDDDGDFVALAHITMISAEKFRAVNDKGEERTAWRLQVSCIGDDFTYLPGAFHTKEDAQRSASELLMSFTDEDQA